MAGVGRSVNGRGRGRRISSSGTTSHPGSSSSPSSVAFRPHTNTRSDGGTSNTNRSVLHHIQHPIPQFRDDMLHDDMEYVNEVPLPVEHDLPQPLNEADPLVTLRQLLEMPGRDAYLTRLDPNPVEGTIWFDRDPKGELARSISQLLKRSFDKPYYSWTVTPRKKQDEYYVDFARRYTWDYDKYDAQVRDKFDEKCVSLMKGMVNKAKGKKQPSWIGLDLWKEMNEYWETDSARSKSSKASNSRLSQRGGLGIHKHLAGQKSFLRIQRELEEKLGRPVSIGEVFVKTHTRSDGSYVDLKAQNICESYDRNVSDRLSQIGGTDGEETSGQRELSTDELNDIFLEASIPDKRGIPYGLGSLSQVYGTGGRGTSTSSCTTVGALQKQLLLAQQMIEEQAAANAAALEQEIQKHQATKSDLDALKCSMDAVINYIQTKDPQFSQPNQTNSPTGFAVFAPNNQNNHF